MNYSNKKQKWYVQFGVRSLTLFFMVAVVGSFIIPVFNHQALASTQVTSRSITMSNSTASATGVTYSVSFIAQSTYTVKAIVVDFCDNTPLIGDSTCTAPAGFDVGGVTPTVTVPNTSALFGATWTAAGSNGFNGNTEYRTLTLSSATGVALTAGSSNVVFNLNSAVNPSTTNHSFYARIVTYTTNTPSYAPGAEGAYTERGGAALSTASVVSVTARVMEQLNFCVYHTTCGDDPAISIGHGANNILDASAVDTASDSFSLSTNANAGVVVRMQGGTLTSGSNSIPAVNGGSSASGSTMTAGTAAFGVDVSTPGALTVINPYVGDGTPTGSYGLDTTSASAVGSTYGSPIASSGGPVNNSISVITYAASASNTTPAGIYTVSEQLIATGTF